ncbi:MAG: amidohydrolase, partial [Saprospiraceae bacterium]
MKEKIQELARQYQQEAVANRRHLHQYPELSFQEVKTGQYVAAKLAEMGVEYQHGMAGNGVVALLKGKNPRKRTIALRGDMDALPI